MKRNSLIWKALAMALVFGFITAVGAVAAEDSITGTIHQSDAGEIMIKAEDGADYMVAGADITEMVGKTVKATGTLTEEGDVKVIEVMSMEEVTD